MSVYLSTGVFRTRSLPEIIAFCQEHGLDHLELSSGVAYRPDLLSPLQKAPGRGLHYLVHNYFPPPADPFVLNLAAADDAIRQRSVAHCQTAIDLAAELGAPFYSVHSGFAFRLTPEMLGDPVTQGTLPAGAYWPHDEAYAIFVDTVRDLAAYAQQRSMGLLLENNVVSPQYLSGRENRGLLLADADEIVRFMGNVSAPNVGLLLDVGHLNVTATALGFARAAFMEQVAPYVHALHLSDNDGTTDDNLPFAADAWFAPWLRTLPDALLVIEVYDLTWSQIQRQLAVVERICG